MINDNIHLFKADYINVVHLLIYIKNNKFKLCSLKKITLTMKIKNISIVSNKYLHKKNITIITNKYSFTYRSMVYH